MFIECNGETHHNRNNRLANKNATMDPIKSVDIENT